MQYSSTPELKQDLARLRQPKGFKCRYFNNSENKTEWTFNAIVKKKQ